MADTKQHGSVPPMPARPRDAASVATDRPTRRRRGFLATVLGVCFGSPLAVGFSSLVMTNVLWLLGTARFMFPNILIEPATRFKVGYPEGFSSGQVETKFKAQHGIWIVRHEYEGQPQIYALRAVCTHLGCTPYWLESEQKFKCPCHGSGFYKNGINFEGPAPRPLERYAIRIADDGQLEVDTNRSYHEESGQWNDSNSFVPV
ncbi:MAG: ubiquinol-cytochrome c reductase iron-sulfur subunit [Pirellulaceae bacterium]